MRSRLLAPAVLTWAALLGTALACPIEISVGITWPGCRCDSSNQHAFTGNVCDSNCTKCKDPCCPEEEFVDRQDAADPVDVTNGNVTYRKVDLRIPGRGIDWEFSRRYLPSGMDGPLGFNWDFNYVVCNESIAF